MKAGMDEFVSKPFTKKALHEAITRWLTQSVS
jgi:FixJ family two-component response regulator